MNDPRRQRASERANERMSERTDVPPQRTLLPSLSPKVGVATFVGCSLFTVLFACVCVHGRSLSLSLSLPPPPSRSPSLPGWLVGRLVGWLAAVAVHGNINRYICLFIFVVLNIFIAIIEAAHEVTELQHSNDFGGNVHDSRRYVDDDWRCCGG